MAMSNASDTYLTGSNIDFLEAQYARYLENPQSVDGTWQELFKSLGRSGRPIVTEGLTLPKRNGNGGAVAAGNALANAGVMAEAFALQGKVDQAVFSFRLRGHLLAQLDPLGMPRPPLDHVADIALVSRAHFSEGELQAPVETQNAFDEPRVPLKRLLERMRKTYCEHIGVEYIHMYDSERRRWLMRRMEHTENRTEFSVEEQKRIFLALAKAEAFEQTIHTKFQGQKRFSIEGGKSLLPMMEELLETGGAFGVREVVIGMAHRGRLAVLANICGKPAEEIFSEIAGPTDPKQYLNRGDVKYHMGYSSDWTTRAGQKVHLSMAFNPSHLGVVHPVVEGRARAKQDRVGGEAGRHAIVPVAIHGDAAFAGQGLVAETLNLSELEGYKTGGTIHIVVNNQVGYTTEADQGRSSLYCTGMAQMLDIPVFHVNGDDPEACVHVMRIATEYRQRFHTDVVIDLVCFRRYGHNEGDVPEFTQPKMYEIIRAKKSVRTTYGDELAKKGRVPAEETEAMFAQAQQGFVDAFNRAKNAPSVKDPSHLQGVWAKYKGGADADVPQVETGVARAKLEPLLKVLSTVPPGFKLHPNVAKAIIDRRHQMLTGEAQLDWGTAEMLAYATLVTEGYRVRVTGQDTERGTFAHRHAVLHDMLTGKTAFPLGELGPGKADVINSPLSEMACMGFEFGYSLDYPDALVAWEAQFGDFANNGQVMIDQFIAAAEDKWRRLSGLTLLLPHGYEGAGPEHSSARLERFLELAAEDNMQVCYPTTAAQIFHLLRRQAVRLIRKPLVVMTPKSLLRLPEASSPWEALATGTYLRVIAEPASPKVTRLLLCSGKVFFDLHANRKSEGVAIARVEQLYPLPTQELVETLKSYPKLTEVYWVQEEPKNSGAWRYMLEPLMALLAQHAPKAKLTYVGRPESASPATGFLKTHQFEQTTLIEEALAKGN
jgi:2-oxoglutarate dehydrogenase E1 component